MIGHRPRLTDAISHGITDQLNLLGRAAGCRPLSWSISTNSGPGWSVTGLAGGGDYTEQEVPDVLAGWAAQWGLTSWDNPVCAGTTEYRGQVDGLRVDVWGVHDRDAFDREYEQNRQRRAAQ